MNKPKPVSENELSLTALDLATRLRAVRCALDASKGLYAEQDLLIADLLALGVLQLTMSDGTVMKLTDNFLDKAGRPRNTAFKACGVSRWSVDFTDVVTASRQGVNRS